MEKIAFKNDWISNFQGLVTLTLHRVILHTIVHNSSTSTYIPNFIEIDDSFCGRTYVRMYVHMHVQMDGRTFETGFIRPTLSKSRPKNISQTLKTETLAIKHLDVINYCSNIKNVLF